MDGREALRGFEEEIFDVLAESSSTKEWAELLRAPLELAAFRGNRDLAQKLVGAGAEFGTALHEAIGSGHEEIVDDLLENGAFVEDTEMTPLHLAALKGASNMVKLLLLEGADKDALVDKGIPPLFWAVGFGRVAAALALIAAGADVRFRSAGRLKMPIAHVAARRGQVEVLRAMIKHGADIEATDAVYQQTALHWAAESTAETVDALEEAGANFDARDRSGSTPLHGAAKRSNPGTLVAILKHGADVNAQNNARETPLHWAAKFAGSQGAAKVVDTLLRSGADETLLDDEGDAAADVVAEDVGEENQLAECVERVCELLANAPVDRAWRCRGYLVLCRSHPDRVELIRKSNKTTAGVTGSVCRRTEMASTEAGDCTDPVGGSAANGDTSGDWAGLMARVLGLHEEGIFRKITGYL